MLRYGLLACLACTCLAACSNASTGGGDACVPGDTATCACADGTLATKTCGGDHRYGTCRCLDPDEPVLELGGEPDPDGLADRRLDFGAVPARSEGVEATIAVRNAGGGLLAVELSALDRPFSVVEQPAGPLARGEEGILRFRFVPERAGEAGAAVSVLSSGGTRRIWLDAVAFAARASCTPNPLDVGVLELGLPAPFELACANEAAGDWPATVTVDGADAAAVAVGIDDPLPGDDGGWRLSGTITPAAPGPLDAWLVLGLADDPVAIVPVAAVAGHLLDAEPGTVDVGYVPPGRSVTARVALRNFGRVPVRVTRLFLAADGDGAFHLDGAGPFDVPPAGEEGPGEVPVEVRFVATAAHRGSRLDGTLVVEHAGPTSPRTVPLTGFVGGPVLACTPEPFELGDVGLGFPFTLPLTCANAGTGDPARTDDRLVVTAVSSSNPAFTVAPHGELRASGYEVGETFALDVTFAPAAPGLASTTLRIESNAVDPWGAPHELAVTGFGLALPPCDYEASPPDLDFGQLARGQAGTLDVAIRNRGDGPCLLHHVELAAGCDPAFSLPAGNVTTALLAPGGQLRVPVRFAPQTEGPDPRRCSVRFDVSNPTDREGTIPLSGTSRRSCLSIERGLDFGAVVPGCASRTRSFQVVSTCDEPVVVTGVRTAPTVSTEFEYVPPALPALVSGKPLAVSVRYLPTDEGEDPGGFFVDVEGSPSLLVPVAGRGAADPAQVDGFDLTDRPKVDVLFAVDKAAPGEPQNLLAAHTSALLSVARDRAIDFQVGVTTSSHDTEGCPGGGEDGRLVPVDGSRARIVASGTPHADAVLSANLQVGFCLADHRLLESVLRALAVTSCDDPRWPEANDGNCGFSRLPAHLSVVAVSPIDDGGAAPASQVAGELRGWKDPANLSFHAIAGPVATGCVGAGYTASPGERLAQLVDELHGTFHSICPTDWDRLAREVSAAVFGADACFELRESPAPGADGVVDGDDLAVARNGLPVAATGPNGAPVWTYVPARNAVCFAADAIPAPGAQLAVGYAAACLPP